MPSTTRGSRHASSCFLLVSAKPTPRSARIAAAATGNVSPTCDASIFGIRRWIGSLLSWKLEASSLEHASSPMIALVRSPRRRRRSRSTKKRKPLSGASKSVTFMWASFVRAFHCFIIGYLTIASYARGVKQICDSVVQPYLCEIMADHRPFFDLIQLALQP